MDYITKLEKEIKNGKKINKLEVLELLKYNVEVLGNSANRIREYFLGNKFDLCTIVNAKSGKCSENCKFCAQSSFYNSNVDEYSLLSEDEVIKEAKYNYDKKVQRFSIVTSGRKLSNDEVDEVCDIVKKINNTVKIKVCSSHGLLNVEQFDKLKKSGVTRIHNNLETSKNNFENVCTTHTYEEKVVAIKSAQSVGLTVCSGGIIGMGESFEDRIDMFLDIRDMGIKSIPINMLNPIKGTPYENIDRITDDEVCKVVAIARFINPDAFIRLAGGRKLLKDKGKKCFMSGANAAITGDMLTTTGTGITDDINMLVELGYEILEV